MQSYGCGRRVPLAMYESLFSPIVFRAERSSLRFSSGGIQNRAIARPMTATTPARAVKKVEAAIVWWMVGVGYSTGPEEMKLVHERKRGLLCEV